VAEEERQQGQDLEGEEDEVSLDYPSPAAAAAAEVGAVSPSSLGRFGVAAVDVQSQALGQEQERPSVEFTANKSKARKLAGSLTHARS
jgi:hypothetical protein